MKQQDASVFNLCVAGNPFAVPEPFGNFHQNTHNHLATPVFRQNCFLVESPAEQFNSKAINGSPKKVTPKRRTKRRSIRI